MNDKALFVITTALNEYPEQYPYDKNWPDDEKEEITFSKWALGELLDEVWNHPQTLASETIFTFAVKCRSYVSSSVMDDSKRIFAIAAETAFKLLEEIEEMEK